MRREARAGRAGASVLPPRIGPAARERMACARRGCRTLRIDGSCSPAGRALS